MKKFLFDSKINFLFLLISFICLLGVVGIENISFQSNKWVHNGDTSLSQLGWYFFKNDVWRFPLGSNPNYGEDLGSSIVFSDSIPILALFFKLFKSFLPENFQYFSLWHFICFYLQLFFSFKILKKFTNSVSYSLIGSIFFLVAPIFVFRLNFNPSIAGQWLLLFALYLGLTKQVDKSKLSWLLLIILSSLINYTFTIVILIIYLVLRLFSFSFDKENILNLIKDFFIISIPLLLTLYIVGYFEVRMADTLNTGFGSDKLNLLSMFDSVHSAENISWSWFLPDFKLTIGEEHEGFNYLGLGQILILFFSLGLFLNKKFKTNLFSIKNNKEIKAVIITSLLLTLWALSNKISFGSYTLIEIPLNKYILAIMSVVSKTGRLFWIVNYFLLILSLVIIFKCFNLKKALSIIVIFLVIQIADTSAGIKKRISYFVPINENTELKDQIWDDLLTKNKILKTTYPINWSGLFYKFSYIMEKNNIEKTNLVVLGRMNRKAAAQARYKLYDDFRNKKLDTNTVYIVYGSSHLRNLKHFFENENVGFFFRDNTWSMVKNEKEQMNANDKKMFREIKPKLLPINEKKNLYFQDIDNYYGFGWSHNFRKLGIWSEGSTSTLFFKTEENYGDLKLEIYLKPYITKKNPTLMFGIHVNGTLAQNIKLKNNQDEKIEISIEEELIKNNEIKIDFNFENPVSPYEVLETPDSRKLGILLKNIKIIPI